MSSDIALMDPAVEEILRDVAADPNSCLLRIPRPKLYSALARGELPERCDTTGLSLAERELVRTYRCEVAYLLRVTCAKLLTELPENALYVSKAVVNGHEIELPTDRAWRRSVRRSLRFDRPHLNDPSAFELLMRCVASAPTLLPTVSELAAASMRLEPTHQARIYAGIDRILWADSRAGIATLNGVLARGPRLVVSSYAWHNIGLAHARRREAVLAFDAYTTAATHDCQQPLALRCLLSAVHLGNLNAARNWASIVDQWPIDHVAIVGIVRQMRAQRRAQRWSTTATAAACMRQLGIADGSATRSVASVFS